MSLSAATLFPRSSEIKNRIQRKAKAYWKHACHKRARKSKIDLAVCTLNLENQEIDLNIEDAGTLHLHRGRVVAFVADVLSADAWWSDDQGTAPPREDDLLDDESDVPAFDNFVPMYMGTKGHGPDSDEVEYA